ncbi:MAG TPA: glycoside hydrolase family 2 TIM barrel-domain containing protein, partial [Verrucomicrobiae bacterium]|nr:glycoside hydrolase family 2 TIM barrel-domain containing protein [Verrucomicrobiae bacterium]
CRHDEQEPGETAKPIPDVPAEPFWRGIEVPGDKNQLRPDLIFAHRLWYRTRVVVPESYAGQSFYLDFPQNNLNTTVRVNGQFCGFNKNPFARFQIDVTRAVRPGTNEVWVGIKDAWYAYSTNPNQPLKLRKKFNLPVKFFSDGFQDLAYPIWDHPQSGLLATPRLAAAGSVYAADVFCQPSVARRELKLEVTLRNPSPELQSGELLCEAVNQRTGLVEKRFAPRPFQIEPESDHVLSLAEAWPDANLWWPDEPNLYRLRSTIRLGERIVDVAETSFGFREWSSRGKHFTLNGAPWHGWADTFTASSPEAWVGFYKEKNQTTMRFWGTQWKGLPPEEALDFFDRHGVAVRRSGMLDGQRIGYFAIENDPELKALHGSPIKMDLMKNWRDQMLAQVRGERNHPSIQLWSLENEWLYINCINLYGGLMDTFEAEVRNVSDAVRALDPTRLTMTDGGGANRDQSMPVHGNHYVWDNSVTVYPDLAYDANPTGGGRGRWVWDEQRPRFLGEDYFIAGHHPELSALGGEAVFAGKAASLPAAGLMARILTEGYRWAEFGAFHFWMNHTDTDRGFYRSFAPRAVFCRQWDGTFASGEQVPRTLGIFNDTRFDDPISLTWSLQIDGRRVAGETAPHSIKAGGNKKFDLTLPMPRVKARTEAEFLLALDVNGREVFRDTKAISILPPIVSDEVTSLIPPPDPATVGDEV